MSTDTEPTTADPIDPPEETTMEHGLSFLPDSEPPGLSGEDYFDMLLDLSVLADEAGLSHVKITEHYLKAYGGYCPSPLAFLAAAAAVTTRVRLMTGCILPVFHHPLQLASEAAMVDVISHGRLDIGFARAYMPYEFDAFGIPLDESRARFTDTVNAVVRLWSETGVTVSSDHFDLVDATILPRPVQSPHPPVWIAAVKSPASFVEAGARGFGLLVTPSLAPMPQMAEFIRIYRESFQPAVEGDRPRVLASLPLYVGEDAEEAIATADHLLDHYLETWARSADAWTGRSSSNYRGYTDMGAGIRASTAEYLRTVGGAVVGSASQAAERISGIQDILGVDGFLWQVDFGGVDGKTARKNVERFCEDVIPLL